VFLIALALFIFWLIVLVARVSHGHEDVVVVGGIQGLFIMDVLAFGPLLWCYEKPIIVFYMFWNFLHMHCILADITSSSFIGFWHQSNGWKE
jgi:hypothetical protein